MPDGAAAGADRFRRPAAARVCAADCCCCAARRLYARLGYREIGIVPTVFNGIPGVDLVLLEKNLEQQ